MLTREEEVWLRAYCGFLAGEGGDFRRQGAPSVTEEALQRFIKRFPPPAETDYRGNPLPKQP